MIAVALWPISQLARAFAQRATYPIDLEWCEGGNLYQAYRLLHRLPLYPSLGEIFAPFPYPPAHALALAAIGSVDLDYTSGRIVSIAFFAVMCAAFYREIVRHFDGRVFGHALGALAIAVIACGYPATGQWYDLVRVDTMTLALSVLAATLISDPHPRAGRLVATAVALAAAVYTKQTAAFFAAWVCLFAIVRKPREGFTLTALALLLCASALVVLEWMTQGRFWFWIFTNVSAHQLDRAQLVEGSRYVIDFAPFLPVLPFAILLLVGARRLSSRTGLWVGMFVAAIPAALLPYAKWGGYVNDLMPMVVLAGPVAILAAGDGLRGGMWWTPALRWTLIVGLALFIWMRPLRIVLYVPDAEMRQAADRLNALVASLPGGVLMPQLAFTPARNGQSNPHWHPMGHRDLEWSGHPPDEHRLVNRALARWALLSSDDHSEFELAVKRQYRFVRPIENDARVHMITGNPVNLNQIWERRPEIDR